MTVQVREQLESDRAEAIRLRDRRLAAGSAADRVAHLQGRNMERMRVGYAALLESRKTDRELLEPLENAFHAIKAKDRFKHYHEAETAWFNCGSTAGRIMRAAAPAMVMRPVAEEVRDRLRALSLSFMKVDRAFAERYCFELSLYCDAVITKQDISFIFSTASLVLGPVLSHVVAPVVAVGSAAGSGGGQRRRGRGGGACGRNWRREGDHHGAKSGRQSGRREGGREPVNLRDDSCGQLQIHARRPAGVCL